MDDSNLLLLEILQQEQYAYLPSDAAKLLQPFLSIDGVVDDVTGYEATVDILDKDADWETLENSLNCSDTKDNSYYQRSTPLLVPMLKNTVRAVKQTSAQQFVDRYSNTLSWICACKEEVVKCIEDGISADRELACCSLLCFCCILERSLKDLLYCSSGQHVYNLSAVITHPDIERLLGPTVTAMLDLVLDPQGSMNIRNLVWHGFRPCDGHYRYLSLLILYLIIQIGHVLLGKGINAIDHPQFQNPELYVRTQIADKHSALISTFNTLPSTELGMVQSSVAAAVSLASGGEYGRAACLLLSCFQYFMRIAFYTLTDQLAVVTTAESLITLITIEQIFQTSIADQGDDDKFCKIMPHNLKAVIQSKLLDHSHILDSLRSMELSYLEVSEPLWNFLYNVVTTTIKVIAGEEMSTDIDKHLCNTKTLITSSIDSQSNLDPNLSAREEL